MPVKGMTSQHVVFLPAEFAQSNSMKEASDVFDLGEGAIRYWKKKRKTLPSMLELGVVLVMQSSLLKLISNTRPLSLMKLKLLTIV
jgi:tRNA U34 5-methylaminomethyl-2-thiouridine-forming methyltransferase MnmC